MRKHIVDDGHPQQRLIVAGKTTPSQTIASKHQHSIRLVIGQRWCTAEGPSWMISLIAFAELSCTEDGNGWYDDGRR